VTSGPGGDLITSRARDVLRAEDVNGDASLTFHAVSEREKRHGQAVAAASLPTIAPLRSADVHTGAARGDTAGADVDHFHRVVNRATSGVDALRAIAPHRIGLPEREGVGER
jgi:hypothetical protein